MRKKSTKRPTKEDLFVLVTLLFGIYMIVGSYNYGETARQFPRLMSSVVIIGCVLLLFKDLLPQPLYSIVAEDVKIVDTESENPENDVFKENRDNETKSYDKAPKQSLLGFEFSSHVGRPLPDMLAVAGGTTLYVTLAYLIGMLWMSPIFAFTYAWWFRLSRIVCVILALLAFGINYLFMSVLILPLDEGILFEGVTWI